MRKSRLIDSQIMAALKQVEAGVNIPDLRNGPRVFAHLMTVMPGVHWAPHSQRTGTAVP